MPSEAEIYAQHADLYERLVSREDYQSNILTTLQRIAPLKGLEVVEPGAGTARLTRILASLARHILALDTSSNMLSTGASLLQERGFNNWQAALADHRSLPVTSHSADLVVSGWSLCYLAVWGGHDWKNDLERAFSEFFRILRPGGKIILLESLGTGNVNPHPPDHLKEYLAYLDKAGFRSTWIRTDYRFASLQEAQELVSFFFGDALADKVRQEGWQTLPECTGIYWKKHHE
jgi:ubiquinone/menaquinone biosynthesis C-methylase UbiE